MNTNITPIKRATIFCRDTERSLACYRDILGLEVIEDKRLEGHAFGRMMGLGECVIRIVHLQAEQSSNGLVGLYGIEQGRPPEAPFVPQPSVQLGQVVLVFYSTELQRIYEKILQAGLSVLSEPKVYEKNTPTSYMPLGKYTEMIFLDPDNVAVNIVQHEELC